MQFQSYWGNTVVRIITWWCVNGTCQVVKTPKRVSSGRRKKEGRRATDTLARVCVWCERRVDVKMYKEFVECSYVW